MFFPLLVLAVVGATFADYHHSEKYHGPPAPLNHDGTVADTDDIKHAKAIFFKAYGEAKHNDHHAPHYHHDDSDHHSHHGDDHHSYSKKYHGPPAPLNHDGTVADTDDVKHAKAIFFKAYGEAKHNDHYAPHYHHNDSDHHSYDGDDHDSYSKKYHGPPAPLNHDGTVADTDDIKHAKAIFFKAYGEAKHNAHYAPEYHHEDSDHHSYHGDSHDLHSKKYHGPPAPLNHDGTVAETPEVKKAKSYHFHLYDQALHRHKRAIQFQPAPLNEDGTVAETPEVQQAKAAFFAALSAEIANADHSWVEPKYEEPQYNNFVAPVQNLLLNKPIYPEPKHHSLAHYSPQPQHYPSQQQHFPAQPHYPAQQHYQPAPAKSASFAPRHSKVSYPHLIHVSNSPVAPSSYEHSHAAPQHSHSHHRQHAEPQYTQSQKHVIPAPLNSDGTVADTPEIQQAKAIHFAAYQEAFARAIPQKHQQQQPQY